MIKKVKKCEGPLEVLEGKYGLKFRKTWKEPTDRNPSSDTNMVLELG